MAEEGASPRELVLEAARRNNTELLEQVISNIRKSTSGGAAADKAVADVLNNAQDGVGNGVLHLAAFYGNLEVLDMLLDQEGLEVDGFDRMDKETPLHKAVKFVNSVPQTDWDAAFPVVEILLDAGCDPRIRNKGKRRPLEIVDPRNTKLRNALMKSEYALAAGNDVVQEDEDDASAGSASDTD